jgi:hypothetical protein
MPRHRKPSKEEILSALSMLEEMSKGGKQVHVFVVINPMILRFNSAIEKRKSYTLVRPDLEIDLVPELSDVIICDPNYLMLAWKGVAVTLAVDAIELPQEEWIH